MDLYFGLFESCFIWYCNRCGLEKRCIVCIDCYGFIDFIEIIILILIYLDVVMIINIFWEFCGYFISDYFIINLDIIGWFLIYSCGKISIIDVFFRNIFCIIVELICKDYFGYILVIIIYLIRICYIGIIDSIDINWYCCIVGVIIVIGRFDLILIFLIGLNIIIGIISFIRFGIVI